MAESKDRRTPHKAHEAEPRHRGRDADEFPPAQVIVAGQTWTIQPRREQSAGRPAAEDEPADWYVDILEDAAHSWGGPSIAGPYPSGQEALSAGIALVLEEIAQRAAEPACAADHGATATAQTSARPAAWSRSRLAHVRRTLGAAFIGALVMLLAVVVLGQIIAVPAWWPSLQPSRRSGQTSTVTRPSDLSTRMLTAIPGIGDTAAVETAQVRTFLLPQTHAGLYKPSIDADGNVWVGQMTTNRLARLDPRTSLVTTWAPPDGRSTLAATAIDRQGNVWFTEQADNYIGRFDPATQTFVTYPLPTPDGRSTMPQDLAFDANGVLWFTQVSSGRLGRLDPANGAIQTYPLPQPPGGGRVSPFGLAVAPNGHIWYSSMTGGVIGELDPATLRVRQYSLADPATRVFALAADPAGRVWFIEFNQGRIGTVDPQTGRVIERDVPATLGGVSGLYGLTVAPDRSVWFGANSINALVRYTPGNDRFTFFVLAIPQSAPYGLICDDTGHIWFTAGAVTASYVGELTP